MVVINCLNFKDLLDYHWIIVYYHKIEELIFEATGKSSITMKFIVL